MKDILNKYFVKDTRNVGKILGNDKLIDVTITSPPYWNLKDYGFKKQIGFGQNYKEYLNDITKIFGEIYKNTKRTGSLWIIVDTIKIKGELLLLPFDLAKELKKIGWKLQDIIIWQKDKSLPWSHQGKFRNIFEYILFFSKTSKFKYNIKNVRELSNLKEYWVKYPERYSPQGKTPSRTWNYAIPRQGSWGKNGNYVKHACPLPPALIERIIMLTTNKQDIVFDPFAGSGSVLATAFALERKYIGIDKNANFKKMFNKDVMPAITNIIVKKNGNTEIVSLFKENFSNIIMSLRALKYPKEVIRLYRKNKYIKESMLIIVLPGGKINHFKYLFVFKTFDEIPINFLLEAKQICSRAPLSKYGMKTEIKAIPLSKLSIYIPNEFKKIPLFIYKNGCFFKYFSEDKMVNLHNFLSNGSSNNYTGDKYPLIISPIHLNIKPSEHSSYLEKLDGKT